MFRKKIDAETSTLEDVKNALLSALGNETPGTDEYEKLLAELERVMKLTSQHPSWSFKPSADVILSGVISIASILLIIKHEQLNVITSKAMSLLPKMKI